MPTRKAPAKPAAKPPTKAAAPAPKVELEIDAPPPPPMEPEDPEEIEQATPKGSDPVKVVNITNHLVSLESGTIDPGDTGIATYAELSTLCNYLEKA